MWLCRVKHLVWRFFIQMTCMHVCRRWMPMGVNVRVTRASGERRGWKQKFRKLGTSFPILCCWMLGTSFKGRFGFITMVETSRTHWWMNWTMTAWWVKLNDKYKILPNNHYHFKKKSESNLTTNSFFRKILWCLYDKKLWHSNNIHT